MEIALHKLLRIGRKKKKERYLANASCGIMEGTSNDSNEANDHLYLDSDLKSENNKGLSKRRFGNMDSISDGCSIKSPLSPHFNSFLDHSSINGKEPEMNRSISQSSRAGEQSEGTSESKIVVPYLRNDWNGNVITGRKAVVFSNSGKHKVGLNFNEIEQLNRRLQLLEEGTELMKKEVFARLQERTELLNEISRHLHTLQKHLRSSENGQLASLSNSIEGRSTTTGLLEVLHPSQNTSSITNRKVNLIDLQDPARVM